MRTILLLTLLIAVTSGCTDPTRVITNQKTEEDKKRQETRKKEIKATNEAYRNFKLSDAARPVSDRQNGQAAQESSDQQVKPQLPKQKQSKQPRNEPERRSQ